MGRAKGLQPAPWRSGLRARPFSANPDAARVGGAWLATQAGPHRPPVRRLSMARALVEASPTARLSVGPHRGAGKALADIAPIRSGRASGGTARRNHPFDGGGRARRRSDADVAGAWKAEAALLIALADIGALEWCASPARSRCGGHGGRHGVRYLLTGAAPRRQVMRPRIRRSPTRDRAMWCWPWQDGAPMSLNLLSDIDLIVFYDRMCRPWRRRRDGCLLHPPHPRDLIRCCTERTADGYVFRSTCGCGRTLLRPRSPSRCRPRSIITSAPARTGSAPLSFKARPSAGIRDRPSPRFMRSRPFIWRKHLDYARLPTCTR